MNHAGNIINILGKQGEKWAALANSERFLGVPISELSHQELLIYVGYLCERQTITDEIVEMPITQPPPAR
jgi:hypothetical protein